MPVLQRERRSDFLESYSQTGGSWLGSNPDSMAPNSQFFHFKSFPPGLFQWFSLPWVCLLPLTHGPPITAQKNLTISALHWVSKSFGHPRVPLLGKDLCVAGGRLHLASLSNAIWAHLSITITTISCDSYIAKISLFIFVFYLIRMKQQFCKLSEGWLYL